MLRSLFEQYASSIPTVTEREIALYERHFALLKEWNESMSLVSPKSLETAFATHYLDSIYLSAFAARYETGPVYDLGTGAGFPGLVHAIRYPDRDITLFEKQMKKQTFLTAAVTQLELSNVRLLGAIPDTKFGGLFLARAVFQREHLFRFFRVHLKAGARLVTSVGGKAELGPVPGFFLKEDQTEYTLPLDCGSRKAELLKFIPNPGRAGGRAN